jgi:PAS domain-containing protein
MDHHSRRLKSSSAPRSIIEINEGDSLFSGYNTRISRKRSDRKAMDTVIDELNASYAKHRTAIDATVASATAENTATETRATDLLTRSLYWLIGVFVATMVVSYVFFRGVAQNLVKVADENLRIRIALDNVSASVMMANPQSQVVYMNKSVETLFRNAESDLRKELPAFRADAVLGQELAVFNKADGTDRSLINANSSEAHRTQFKIGGRTFALTSNAVVNAQGERIGSVLEWVDRTGEVAIEQEVADLVYAAGMGDFGKRLDVKGKEGFFRGLSEGMNNLMDTSESGLQEVVRVLNALSNGGFAGTINCEGMRDDASPPNTRFVRGGSSAMNPMLGEFIFTNCATTE